MSEYHYGLLIGAMTAAGILLLSVGLWLDRTAPALSRFPKDEGPHGLHVVPKG